MSDFVPMEYQSEACRHFQQLKRTYEGQRELYEESWAEAWHFYNNSEEMSKVFEGYSNIRVPKIDSKVNHTLGRLESVIFNISRIGRYEVQNTSTVNPMVVEALNRYVFTNQLKQMQFKSQYHLFDLQKVVTGSSVAKLCQEYGEGSLSYAGEAPRQYVVKDNPSFKPLILTEFYSDAYQPNIQESQACIHSTMIPFANLEAEAAYIETSIDESGGLAGEVRGRYFNLELLRPGQGMTEEAKEYLERLGGDKAAVALFSQGLNEGAKQGLIAVDECYGKFDLGAGPEEVICTIANGSIVIRLEPTPFKHKRYVRPFIFGRFKPLLGLLYGESNVTKSIPLMKELNATRSQMTDARTFSIFPMLQVNKQNLVKWDGKWTPFGIIESNSNNPVIIPIMSPYLGAIATADINLILRDLDELWAISPIQQGTSDSRLIPGTATATMALIAQNDYILDMIVADAFELELLPLFEMLLERNLTFKSPSEFLSVLTPVELKQVSAEDFVALPELVWDITINISGSTELSMEQATRQGYQMLLGLSQQIPNLARRIDYTKLTEKLLASFGIKDDASELFIPEEDVQAVMAAEQAQAQDQMQQMQAALQQAQAENQALAAKLANKPVEELQMHQMKGQIDLQRSTMEEQMKTEEATKRRMAEVEIENRSGKRVN